MTRTITTILKRDGRTSIYDVKKIADAIYKAAASLGGDDYDTSLELAHQVEEYILQTTEGTPSVETIQDAVEKILIENGHARTAKEFILYRAARSQAREMNTRLMKVYEDITFQDAADNELKRENANIDGNTAMGTMLKYGSEGAKQFYDMFILDPKHSKAHKEGDIHIHDFDFYSLTTTCCQIDLETLFKDGFDTGHGFIREPQTIQTYAALACIAIQSNQNDQHGGQSVPNFDYSMSHGVVKTYRRLYARNLEKSLDFFGIESPDIKAKEIMEKVLLETNLTPILADDNGYQEAQLPYLVEVFGNEKDAATTTRFTRTHAKKETERDTFQAMEALVHNLNTMHSRAGAQVPFSSLNYGTDISPEGKLVILSILKATEQGMGGGETAIFPIHIFKVKEGVNYNPEDPGYELFQYAMKVSAKRLFPNFSFLDAPFNAAYYQAGKPETEAAYMGCRTRVVSNVYDPTQETVNGRGNLSFTSINLPRLAIKANGNVDLFFDDLQDKMSLVFEQLLARFEVIADKKVKNFPFLMGQGIWLDSDKLQPEDSIREVIKHGTLTVGFIGLAEALKALLGKHHGESAEAQNLGLDIVGFMRSQCDIKAKETKLNYSLIATPAEGLSGRFVKIDRAVFGEIAGVTDREYYTNSFHIPVYYDISAFEKINLEAPYHALTNAGHISYVELDGDPLKNLEAFEAIIRHMKESGIGYGSVNHPVDRDPICGYHGIIDNECPGCQRQEHEGHLGFERIRRITGYLVGTLDRFNNAKRAEERDRVKHGLSQSVEQEEQLTIEPA